MNELDRQYFLALSHDRAESAEMLNKPSMRGIKRSVVEKYSDQAHFIYELLQNADDAKATSARFILEPNQLVFAHNGTRFFSVSNPATEHEDSDNGIMGDINAITSIANSNKTESSIGKFGVGFKAVFQYTNTPHIYDPNFSFRIENFIVPSLLDHDYPKRHPQETLFVFPFDHPDKNSQDAYLDISEKLQGLSYPLLFLTNLEYIEYEFSDSIGLYSKEVYQTINFGDTYAEKICLTRNYDEEILDEFFWIFSRNDEQNRQYSIGYATTIDGDLIPTDEPAFCFFPTKENTNLNFIIHAPFLLTDSREGIRAGEYHNIHMIDLLARLAADSLLYLRDFGIDTSQRIIDDSIVEIIPVDPSVFSDPENRNQLSFYPFYQRILNLFLDQKIVPSKAGYAYARHAYWPTTSQLPIIFSDQQLAAICENPNAKWAFPKLARETIRSKSALYHFIDLITKTFVNEDAILNGRQAEYIYDPFIKERKRLTEIKGIDKQFIESQSIDWLHSFYKWIAESRTRVDKIRNKPVFIDQDGIAAPAFDAKDRLVLFLPIDEISGYRTVHSELLTNEKTVTLIELVGITTPSIKDRIYNIILPMYDKKESFDTDAHFKLFFDYYCNSPNNEVKALTKLLRKYAFIKCFTLESDTVVYGSPGSVYFPSDLLLDYFETKPSTLFVDLSGYEALLDNQNIDQLKTFLIELGVNSDIAINMHSLDGTERQDLPAPRSTKGIRWSEPIIDGCKELLSYIEDVHDTSKSLLLWNQLINIIQTRCNNWRCDNLETLLQGQCDYFFRRESTQSFPSSDTIALRSSQWLVNEEGEFCSPDNITKYSLSRSYDRNSVAAHELIRFLNIPETIAKNSEKDFLTDSQREQIEFAKRFKDLGITEQDIAELIRIKEQRIGSQIHKEPEMIATNDEVTKVSTPDQSEIQQTNSSATQEVITEEKARTKEKDSNNQMLAVKTHPTTRRILDDIGRQTQQRPSPTPKYKDTVREKLEVDQDEYLPAPVNYQRRIDLAKQKSAAEIDRIAYLEDLQHQALSSTKYSFQWFQTLLEMEEINSGESNKNSREVSISFSIVDREPKTKRTLILKQPNRYIPQFIEDLADIPLVLHFGDTKKTIAIEVANIKSYTLRVKMKNPSAIDGLDLNTITEATIDAKSPAFLLAELRTQFNQLNYPPDYDMQTNLSKNIEFIFGPPGTGKTTYLARNYLIPLMKKKEDLRILVLTPTNKAADVLTSRVIELSEDDSYQDWLIRFGTTYEESIEQNPVYKDKTFDIRAMHKSVTITTIARFPYDFFMPENQRIFLHGLHWDYIVIDEASMIPLVNIVYPLYKKTPIKFIIAGDPFQIEPITSIDLWRNENIYTLVQLDSFVNPTTVPHSYAIRLLTKQYRSIPVIADIYSKFTYGGVLKHHRAMDSQRSLFLEENLGIKTLNIIKFPTSKYESIYRPKRLNNSSPYHIYSALFSFEYLCYLSRKIAVNTKNEICKIGVIAPYRVQADLIDKLLASENLPISVEVQVDTIHGFQGDECDIIFAVLNPPPFISDSNDMFLNKRNIINVAISRAKDYLFLLMPDDETKNIHNLRLVKQVERLFKKTEDWSEMQAKDLERLMFGRDQFLEDNAFSTSHQNVNVYGFPEKRYEVRSEESAVDIQIHRNIQSDH